MSHPRSSRHVAVKIGASLSLEAAQLHFQVLELLTGETRDVLLTQQRLAVALDAVELLGELRGAGRVGWVGLVGRWPWFLRGEIGGKIVHVGVGEIRSH